jgi:hypothetical protein
MNLKHALTAALLTTVGPATWSLAETAMTPAKDSSNTTSIRVDSQSTQLIEGDHATVKFPAGSSDVSPNEKDKLRTLVESAKQAPVDTFVVAAWSDKKFPEAGAELTDADRTLARARAEAIEDVLDDLGVRSVDTYSMATHPSWMATTFNRESSTIKTGDGKASGSQQVNAQIGQKIRAEGGPGLAVVVVRFENQSTSH